MATCCQLSSLWLSSLLIQFWWWLMAPLIYCLCCDRQHIMILFADRSWSCIFVNSVLKKILVIFNMPPSHIAVQRSHRETLLLYSLHRGWASVPLKRGWRPLKNVLALNVHQVSSSRQHAKDLATLISPDYAFMPLVLLFFFVSCILDCFVLRGRKGRVYVLLVCCCCCF